MLVVDGYFVHFMAPERFSQTLPKDIIFVLDVFGSMEGLKIQQLQSAMTATLSYLRPKYRFNIIPFRTELSRWKDGLVEANQITITNAKQYAQRMRAHGGNNINAALLEVLGEIKVII